MDQDARPNDTPRAGKIRCLGPGKEHSFHSPDVRRYRVCAKCQRKINLLPFAAQHANDERIVDSQAPREKGQD